MADGETPLSGGNMSSGVVRVGDTVRRPAGPWTPAVHALLAHLHEAGFRCAPRPLGALGTQPWARLWQEGHGDVWQADVGYITQREGQWHQALLG
jgi:hypothetical protein